MKERDDYKVCFSKAQKQINTEKQKYIHQHLAFSRQFERRATLIKDYYNPQFCEEDQKEEEEDQKEDAEQ
jgi:hypothetical protein